MSKTLMEIMEPEINERVNTARADERRTVYFSLVQDGDLSVAKAAQKSNMTTDQFRTEMTAHGYHLPQAQTI